MSKQGGAATSAGSGVLIGGIGLVLAIAAGTLFLLQEDDLPSDAEVSELVAQTPSVGTVETALPEVDGATTEDAATTTTEQEQPAIVDSAETEAAQADAADTSQPEEKVETAETPVDAAPTIDEVRLDGDGLAVVAGRAEPGAQVDVVVDGEVVASTSADASGSFAAVGIVEPSDAPRVLSLSAQGADAVTPSDDEVILAPLAAQPVPESTAAVEQDSGANTTPAETQIPASTETASETPAEQPPAAAVVELAEDAQDNAAPVAEGATEVAKDSAGIAEEAPSQTLALSSSGTAEVPKSEPEQQEQAETSLQAQVEAEAPTTLIDAPQPEAQPEVAAVEPLQSPEAAPQIALLKSTAEGVQLLGTAPTPPRQIQLDTIGYTDGGVVSLAGRASVEAVEVRVYLNNRSIARLRVNEQGSWRGELPGIDPGIYTLRVDALNSEGSVTSRVETPFKREEPAILAAAAAGADGPVKAITVQTGDTLWAIARDRYGEGVLYVRVFEANRSSIRDPDLIFPGQVFDLPTD